MSRSKLDLSGIDETPPNRDPAVLREISETAGFPSRPAGGPAPAPASPAAPERASASEFRRPARPTGNRHIAINVRVDAQTAGRIYALRDARPKQTIADVIEEAVQALHDKQLGSDPS